MKVLSNLPFPVAHPRSFVGERNLSATDRLHNAQFAAYQAIRTTALLLLADYLESSSTCPGVDAAVRGLGLPHWKEWVDLADVLARFWNGNFCKGQPGPSPRFPALVEGWLTQAYGRKVNTKPPWERLLAGLPGLQANTARNAVDAFWAARNARAHAEGTRTGEHAVRDERLLDQLDPVLDSMLAALFPDGELVLYRRFPGDQPSVIRLQGPHPDLCFDLEPMPMGLSPVFARSDVVALARTGAVPVHPLFLAFDPENPSDAGGSGGLIEDLYLVDSLSETKVVALGVLKWKTLPALLVREVHERFATRGLTFGLQRKQAAPWSLVSLSADRATRRLQDLTGQSYFPSFYLQRAGVDDVLDSALGLGPGAGDEPGDSRRGIAVLILGEAGSGKSSLLARLAAGLLRSDAEARDAAREFSIEEPERRDPEGDRDLIFYLSGAEAYPRERSLDPAALLSEAVTRQADILRGEFSGLADFCRHLSARAKEDRRPGRKIWILLDSLNEADRFTDLVEALDAFLTDVPAFPNLRLVVAMRAGAYHSLARRDRVAMVQGSEVFRNARSWHTFSLRPSPGGPFSTPVRRGAPFGESTAPYLEVRPFNPENEGEKAYRLRQCAPGLPSCRTDWNALAAPLREILLSPLHLHLFHEAFAGESRPPIASEARLLDAFLEGLAGRSGGLADKLLELGRRMRLTRRPILPIEMAGDWVRTWRESLQGLPAACAKLDPVEELISASLLTRTSEESAVPGTWPGGFSFTHQRLAEAVLARAIRHDVARASNRLEGPDPKTLLGIAAEASQPDSPYPELVGAVEMLVVDAVEKGDGESVAALLGVESLADRRRLLRAAFAAYGRLRGASTDRPPLAEAFWSSLRMGLWKGRDPWRLGFDACFIAECCFSEGLSTAACEVGQIGLDALNGVFEDDLPPNFDWEEYERLYESPTEEQGREVCVPEKSPTELEHEAEMSRLHRESLSPEPLTSWLAVHPPTLRLLSYHFSCQGRTAEAIAFAERAVLVARALVSREPTESSRKWRLSQALYTLGQIHGEAGDTQLAEAFLRESLSAFGAGDMKDADPLRIEADLIPARNELAILLAKKGELKEAADLCDQSVATTRALSKGAGADRAWKRLLADSLFSRSECARARGDDDTAQADLGEAVELARQIVADAPHDLAANVDLAFFVGKLGDVAARTGNGPRSVELSEKAVEILCSLVPADPRRVDLRLLLAGELGMLSERRAAGGNRQTAAAAARERAEITTELLRVNPDQPRWKREHESAVAALALLGEDAPSAMPGGDGKISAEDGRGPG